MLETVGNKLVRGMGLATMLVLIGGPAFAAGAGAIDLTASWAGIASLLIFCGAYCLVIAEEYTQMRKSKPVLLAAGIIWGLIALMYTTNGLPQEVEDAARENILEYAELLLFLLVAMTYINAMDERKVFETLRSRLVCAGFSLRNLFWITGGIAFFLSPVADNLTTAMLMCAVVTAIGRDNSRFIGLACINIVIAANAGGAFSPFGDITTLMVWQKGMVDFLTFFRLFTPALVNWLIPAVILSCFVPPMKPAPCPIDIQLKRGAVIVMCLFFLTIITAVVFHKFLNLPPMMGMMTGLAYLKLFGFYLKITHLNQNGYPGYDPKKAEERIGDTVAFDVFRSIARAEWDTLMFFYGVVLCVGGLGFIGYLGIVSRAIYIGLGPTTANIMVGMLSAVFDNIPIMFAVLTMQPDMSTGHWLLVTLTTGVGGSMLSIGSAAGVALMGQARGSYTFFSHLKWTPVIALGYGASIWVHFFINRSFF